MLLRPPRSTRTAPPFPYTAPFRSLDLDGAGFHVRHRQLDDLDDLDLVRARAGGDGRVAGFPPCLLERRLATERANVVELVDTAADQRDRGRSEEHTSELQSLMRISYAVFCLKKKKKITYSTT